MINGGRTRDIQDHNLALYQLSYDHRGSRFLPEPAVDRNGVRGPTCGRSQVVRALGLLVMAGASAAAQPVATGPAPPPAPRPAHPPAGLGANLGVGWAGDGWVARLDYDVLPVMAPSGEAGAVLGFAPALEIWRDKPDWGFAIPLALIGGIRVLPVRATIGVGLDALLVDRVDDDTGFGLWAPFACANVGLDLYGARVGVDARVVRRWQLGAPDFTQWQLAIYAGYTGGTPKRNR